MKVMFAAGIALLVMVGSASAEQRSLAGFTRVAARAGTDVEVTVGPAFRVEVVGRDAARIVTRVDGDELIIEPLRANWVQRALRDAQVRVTMPDVEALSASSGADLTATGLDSASLSLAASSGADLRVSGRCGTFAANASSGSDIHAQSLRCENGSVDVSSGADARVYASGRLNVDASSGGGVIAHGDLSLGDVDLSTGGSVRRANG